MSYKAISRGGSTQELSANRGACWLSSAGDRQGMATQHSSPREAVQAPAPPLQLPASQERKFCHSVVIISISL